MREEDNNTILRILMGMHHSAKMSNNLIRRGLDPFKGIVRKLSWSFRCKVLQSDNILFSTPLTDIYE